MKKSKIYIAITLSIISLIILTIIVFFSRNNYKKSKIGNNNINKTSEIEKIIESEYEATIEVTVTSNKNTNKYKLKQVHTSEKDEQEVLAPETIEGVKLIYQNNTLEIQNTKLNLSKIYSDYEYLEDNNLWLNSFAKQYKAAENKTIEEDEENIILHIESNDKNIKHKKLYIDKNIQKPTKLLLQDNNQINIIYILYTEITLK